MTAKKMTKSNAPITDGEIDTSQKSVRKIDAEEMILCKSNCNGELLCDGAKSGYMYTWADYGDVEEVMYKDLQYMIKQPANKMINEPRIIIMDDDIVSQNPKLQNIYESLYDNMDLNSIFDLPIKNMIHTISTLPNSIQDTIKSLAASAIERRTLDSVQKIKALDELFGTNLLLTLVQN